jgi:Zn-dependent protease
VNASLLLEFVLTLPVLVVSLVLHELAHGTAAAALGDPTARRLGRLSLNPLVHLDTWGSGMLVLSFLASGGGFFFGWAKPVPITPALLRAPRRDMMLVGAAGPLANYALAGIAAATIWAVRDTSGFVVGALTLAFVLNVVLGTLNLIPLPPLDGSRVLGGLLPLRLYRHWLRLDRFSGYMLPVMLLVMIAEPDVFSRTVGATLNWAATVLLPGRD